MARVYIETSIVSHAVSRPSRSAHLAFLQQQARDWWEKESGKFDLVTSQLVLDEASRGDPEMVARRMSLLESIPLVLVSPAVFELADRIVKDALIPAKAASDAVHVATAACNEVEYLLTLNCRHIANAHILPKVYRIVRERGYGDFLICTPAEFLGGLNEKSE